ncbi:MAG: type II toxin-antitoxin system RelE family toxin [Candidatus Binataceae bacterium]
MAYTIDFTPVAEHQFKNLSREIQTRLSPHIDALANNPRPPGVKKLKGGDNYWRIRVGDYRLLYEIHDNVLLVLAVRIAHRREAYR